jgi:hypothetical protein
MGQFISGSTIVPVILGRRSELRGRHHPFGKERSTPLPFQKIIKKDKEKKIGEKRQKWRKIAKSN